MTPPKSDEAERERPSQEGYENNIIASQSADWRGNDIGSCYIIQTTSISFAGGRL